MVVFFSPRSDIIRSRVTLDEINGLEITIPAARSRYIVAFLGVWLTGWALGEVMALAALVAMALGLPMGQGQVIGGTLPPSIFLTLWLAGWTVGGILVMEILAWQLRGREGIRIDPNGEGLAVARLGGLLPRRKRTFPLHQIRNLRYAPSNPMAGFPFPSREALEAQLQWFGIAGGAIAFDHPGGTARFGAQLSEMESRRLIKTIKEHYKIEDDQDEPLPVERL